MMKVCAMDGETLLTFNASISWTFLANSNWYSSFGWIRLNVWTTDSSLRSEAKTNDITENYFDFK